MCIESIVSPVFVFTFSFSINCAALVCIVLMVIVSIERRENTFMCIKVQGNKKLKWEDELICLNRCSFLALEHVHVHRTEEMWSVHMCCCDSVDV